VSGEEEIFLGEFVGYFEWLKWENGQQVEAGLK
jgi:hypothetical protein